MLAVGIKPQGVINSFYACMQDTQKTLSHVCISWPCSRHRNLGSNSLAVALVYTSLVSGLQEPPWRCLGGRASSLFPQLAMLLPTHRCHQPLAAVPPSLPPAYAITFVLGAGVGHVTSIAGHDDRSSIMMNGEMSSAHHFFFLEGRGSFKKKNVVQQAVLTVSTCAPLQWAVSESAARDRTWSTFK